MREGPKVLARDRKTNKLVLFHVNPDGSFTLETRFDIEPSIDFNTVVRQHAPSGWKADTHHVANIPMPIFQSLRDEGVVQDKKDFARWLNDRDHSKFRSKGGKV